MESTHIRDAAATADAPHTTSSTREGHRVAGLGAFSSYQPLADTFDEVFDADGKPRPALEGVIECLKGIDRGELRRLQKLARDNFLRGGVTFSVYAHGDADPDRIFPFDLMPRVVTRSE